VPGGDRFMDFIHRPNGKILKILKIKITTFRKLTLLTSSGEEQFPKRRDFNF
jgi:hypothetical protein